MVAGSALEIAGLEAAPLVAWLPRLLRWGFRAQFADEGKAEVSTPLSDPSLLEERTICCDGGSGDGCVGACREEFLEEVPPPGSGRCV